jgi:16S rRNA (adenine1518-N6/adenine1519-N6)-dimethyltransferase
LDRIVAAADSEGVDTVVEVGAGTGMLTERLAARAGRLIAVEVDPALVLGLRERFAGRGNVSVVEADALAATPAELLSAGGGGTPYAVVGNLPYNVGTPIVRRFLESAVKPRWMVVMLQAEVGQSVAAKPGEMSYLSVQMQLYAEARVLFYVPPRAFKPAPKVRSAVVRLDIGDGPAVEVDDREAFLALVRAGFAAPRKQMRNSLAVGLRVKGAEADAMLAEAGLEGSQRPADLSMLDWKALYYAYRSQEPGARSQGAGEEEGSRKREKGDRQGRPADKERGREAVR